MAEKSCPKFFVGQSMRTEVEGVSKKVDKRFGSQLENY